MKEQETVRLWARLGVTLETTKEEAEILSGKDYLKAEALLMKLIRSDRCFLDGETYFPERDRIDDEDKTPDIELDFDLDGPLHPTPEKEFTVDTPHGTLHIHANEDKEYPGVWVDLEQPDGYDITLSLVEYIPDGEGISDYDLSHPIRMLRQQEEVPESRREGNRVTAGFVSRSWPDERHQEDYHNRTFHTGYPRPLEQSLDQKLKDADERHTQFEQHAKQDGPDR